MSLRRKPEKKLDPRIEQLTNSVTGETKWRVAKNGVVIGGGVLRPYWSEDFDTLEEAEACFAEKFGWETVETFQPGGIDE